MLAPKPSDPIETGALAVPLPAGDHTVPSTDPSTAERWFRSGNALLVDVREADEFAEERIPGSLLMPMSYFDAEFFPQLPCMKTVLLCLSGKRSNAAGKQLIEAGFENVFQIENGLVGWKEAGLETEL